MSEFKLEWDQVGQKEYEAGVDHGVLYTAKDEDPYGLATAWSGLVSVAESPTGAEPTDNYADNIKYVTLRSAESFEGTIECFTYPKEFKACNGELDLVEGVSFGQQARDSFGMSYRTIKGNDTKGDGYGYKLHLVYGLTCSPSEKSYSTVNDSPEIITFSFPVTSTPAPVGELKSVNGRPLKAVSLIVIDSTTIDPSKLKKLEEILYGNGADTAGRLPLPTELDTILKN